MAGTPVAVAVPATANSLRRLKRYRQPRRFSAKIFGSSSANRSFSCSLSVILRPFRKNLPSLPLTAYRMPTPHVNQETNMVRTEFPGRTTIGNQEFCKQGALSLCRHKKENASVVWSIGICAMCQQEFDHIFLPRVDGDLEGSVAVFVSSVHVSSILQ